MQKRILTIEDLSAIGKTSLGVAIPTISAFGHEVIPVPTALLSSNTSFPGFTCLDLTEEMVKILKHFDSLNQSFDALYTGYLGSLKQIDIIISYLEKHPNINYYLDPAYADDGELYKGFDANFSLKMLDLVKKAKVIIPNITEAELLLMLPHKEFYSDLELEQIAKKLASLGPSYVIITGCNKASKITNYGYDALNKKAYQFSYKRLSLDYYGTGDLFASLIVGALEAGLDLEEALELSGNYLSKVINHSIALGLTKSDGISFETYLSELGGRANE